MKIVIMGYSGCGKSTLARKLSQLHGLSLLHLDSVHFQAGWVEKETALEHAEVEAFLDSHESWVIDGNYSKLSLQRRLEEADQIISLELNRWVCLWRILKRWKRYRGHSRPDLAEGCPEKVDWEFVRWVLKDGRSPRHLAAFEHRAQLYGDKMIRIQSVKEQKEYLQSLEGQK